MPRDLSELCVLIVEDNVRNYALLARLLSFMGVKQTEWRRSGWQILEFAQDTMPHVDLILLDIHLPEEDGYQVLARLREDDRFQGTRIVAVTADISSSNLAKARSCLLYTSDAADDLPCVDLGGRRIIKKKQRQKSRIFL